MSKFLSLVLVLFICAGFSGIAESIDLDSMSAYELFELQLKVQEKLYEVDPASGFILYPGTYVVGRDLKAGSYIFSVVEHLESPLNIAYISVYRNEEDFENLESVRELESRFTPGQEDVAQYNLNDGEVIKFNYGIFQYVKR